ncbi:hypothetical protein RchiOBHm_Chr2g0175331 [Rosa chinensis]|uniref:Uncharacterized protein n=1 Tax=Rosa chinensis TaxID=74649 RepID=A0A2P6S6E8_ROSCH|nr:hypothetical protein RchiOBHm_Chr2g0175331 [Rosa chinensis]
MHSRLSIFSQSVRVDLLISVVFGIGETRLLVLVNYLSNVGDIVFVVVAFVTSPEVVGNLTRVTFIACDSSFYDLTGGCRKSHQNSFYCL